MKMQHPRSDHVIDVAPAQIEMYEAQGWRQAAAAPRKKTSARTATIPPAPAAETKE